MCWRDENSSQIDILITACEKPTLFRDGELVLVTPDTVGAIIEVKTSLGSRLEIQNAINKLSINVEKTRISGNSDCQAGLFVYDRKKIADEIILQALQSAADGQENKVINWIAFGPNLFFRFWESGQAVHSSCNGPVWHSYDLPDGLAHAYFVSNVVWDVGRQNSLDMQYAWFPVEGGKERYRRWYIPLSNGEAVEFNQ